MYDKYGPTILFILPFGIGRERDAKHRVLSIWRYFEITHAAEPFHIRMPPFFLKCSLSWSLGLQARMLSRVYMLIVAEQGVEELPYAG